MMRVLNEGHSPTVSRWRLGYIQRTNGHLAFYPHRPADATPIDLIDAQILGLREAMRAEIWRFDGRTVLLAESPTLGQIEFGFRSRKWMDLALEHAFV